MADVTRTSSSHLYAACWIDTRRPAPSAAQRIADSRVPGATVSPFRRPALWPIPRQLGAGFARRSRRPATTTIAGVPRWLVAHGTLVEARRTPAPGVVGAMEGLRLAAHIVRYEELVATAVVAALPKPERVRGGCALAVAT
jgi:hypothetical protein